PGSTDQRNIHIPLTNERNTDNSTCRSYIKMEFVTALNVRSQEVNDNPNIDAGIEDMVMKEDLHLEVMRSLYKRIEMSRNLSRFISVEKY
ncbi:MAG: hypothetical protein RBS73_16775, partial [Prolixibacteraceae bacterium]|nr:hypothetical protein [Prolixibacteraceae bacterium]